MASNQEIEIKFRAASLRKIIAGLRAAGFRRITQRTHELNTLYDLPGHPLQRRGELLRLREYGTAWTLTHKSRGKGGRYKTRLEIETAVQEGHKMELILRALGFRPGFRYEKFRAEWSDGSGHVVVDETPIGNFGEIEGRPRWIDRTARILEIQPADYITDTYLQLFAQWKQRTRSVAKEMTFHAISRRRGSR